MRRIVFWALGLAIAVSASAEIKLPAVMSDNMVLQADKPACVWGWAEPGETVAVALEGGKAVQAAAGQDGRWSVALPAQKAGTQATVQIKTAKDSKAIKNVLFGEVWVASGQSNMQWTVKQSIDAEREIAEASYPKIRMFNLVRETAETPQTDCKGQWLECSPATVGEFSAVGYFFGRFLHKELDVPVGVINTSWGGTPAEAWTSRAALETEPILKPRLDAWDRQVADAPKVEEDFKQKMIDWKKKADIAKAERKPQPERPKPPQDARRSPHRPANLYNGMIAPILPYTIRGAIWYQGESNVSRAWEYRVLFPLMIRNWREMFKKGDFPFGFVQLAPFNYRGQDPYWCAELREAQTHTLKTVPNTGMAVIMDIGDPKDIHPKNKQEVGRRLGLWALAKTYGKNVVFSGPLFAGMTVEGEKVRVKFANAERGLITSDDKPPTCFTLAGDDQKFYPAAAAIDGDTVVVSCEKVKKPVAVRFAWANDAEPNLKSADKLPAAPFKSDNWRWLTEQSSFGNGIDQLVAQNSGLRKGDRIAFLGDSITAGGVRPDGYVWLIEDALARRAPDREVEVIRAGISGHKVPNLQERLERDVLSKKPTAVFIYIGINDVWHSLKGQGTPKDKYEAGLRDLITRIRDAGATVILATPSAIGEKNDGANQLDDMLDEYSAISRKVAQSMGVQLCDLRAAFVSQLKQLNPENKDRGVLTGDTVHLNAAGNRLVAEKAAESIAQAMKKRK